MQLGDTEMVFQNGRWTNQDNPSSSSSSTSSSSAPLKENKRASNSQNNQQDSSEKDAKIQQLQQEVEKHRSLAYKYQLKYQLACELLTQQAIEYEAQKQELQQ
eukprot:TRINITY_DN667_c1_g2_i1.p1 TRINITY_DN667_c1_g2~~TRINITY_DN667_c1_g2_i1.p1  ORF type:complete len:103 (+),score=34.55 TRINITY_DN667_c1_g2_i1:297-605(+)